MFQARYASSVELFVGFLKTSIIALIDYLTIIWKYFSSEPFFELWEQMVVTEGQIGINSLILAIAMSEVWAIAFIFLKQHFIFRQVRPFFF